jgi:hypothetical protein
MPMLHKQSGKWLLMFHYNFTMGANHQGGPRGVTKFESANWFMPSAVRRVGRGTLELRGMFSAEAFTFPPGGSPLLFQTGETYKGEPLIDRQHPHDLFMELSANYTVPVGERASWFVYAGYPGEPALGPNAFMHRASASENTSARFRITCRTRRTSLSEWSPAARAISGTLNRRRSRSAATSRSIQNRRSWIRFMDRIRCRGKFL